MSSVFITFQYVLAIAQLFLRFLALREDDKGEFLSSQACITRVAMQ